MGYFYHHFVEETSNAMKNHHEVEECLFFIEAYVLQVKNPINVIIPRNLLHSLYK
jgi:hypothetical protein